MLFFIVVGIKCDVRRTDVIPVSQQMFWLSPLQPIAEEYHNGQLLGYRVSFRGMHDMAPSVVWEDISSLSTTLFQLDAHRDYFITVAVNNSAGLSPAAMLSIATTNDCESIIALLVSSLFYHV